MKSVTNVPHSVRARITALAHARGEQVQRVFERYAMERILHRLSRSTHRDELVLKGAALWVVWRGPNFRPTRDRSPAAMIASDFDTPSRPICETRDRSRMRPESSGSRESGSR